MRSFRKHHSGCSSLRRRPGGGGHRQKVIETHAHEQMAKALSATYGQGYFYAKPGALPVSVAAPVDPIPIRQRVEPLDGRTPFEVLWATITPERCEKPFLAPISSHLEKQCIDAAKNAVVLAGFQKGTLFSRTQQARYRQLVASNVLTIVLAEGLTRRTDIQR
ncbi:MAG: EAL domain-containing protein [Ferrimicrobium sp.]|nr:EAL domain-containing protein [Ferrimicrobium sp.]